ncbi:MAG: hypothetical protein ACFCD0_09890 [Gemmataceae bacterium]
MNPQMGEQGHLDREKLAAYVDGEYEGNDALTPEKEQIEAWLEQSPEAIDDVRAWRRLKQLWQATTPPEPSEDAWMRTQAGLQSRCVNPAHLTRSQPSKPNHARFRRWGLWLGGLVAAALIVGCFSAQRWLLPSISGGNNTHAHFDLGETSPEEKEPRNVQILGPDQKTPTTDIRKPIPVITPFAVASSSEVHMHSAEVADLDIWLVGTSPIEGRLPPVAPGEVSEVNLPADDPEYYMSNDPPMIMMVGDVD